MFKSRKISKPTIYEDVTSGMKQVYKDNLLPLETEYKFHDFHSPMMLDPDFDGKPLVMLVGQFSTGKTTFIRYLIDKDFPGMRISPEPTTDHFHVVDYGDEDGKIPGNVLAFDTKKPFSQLQQFGGKFLQKFECSTTKSEVLKSLCLVDTPGILAGEKQSLNRGYDFAEVLKWFAERADRIILLFDAHKLDISDEFKQAIMSVREHDDKIRICLNKADMMTTQQLMRVYGALMWSLSRILGNPEVSRIYVGSFWNQPLQHSANRELFEAEQDDLFDDLQSLPKFATIRRLNDLIKRARMVKVHALIITYLKKQMPMIGKASKKEELLRKLEKVFQAIETEHKIPASDFPDVDTMRKNLVQYDFSKFNSYDQRLVEKVDKMLTEEIPRLMNLIPQEDLTRDREGLARVSSVGVFSKETLPGGVGFSEGEGEPVWIVSKDKAKYDDIFNSLEQMGGKVTGNSAKVEMMKSNLPKTILGKIWKLADTDKDGMLDNDEFALAMHLIKTKVSGHDLPEELPRHLVPPAKRSGAHVFD